MKQSAALLVLVISVALGAAACGGGSAPVDKGGFTAKDRTNAQAELDTFKGTAIPGTIVQLTATIGLPAVCRVHYAKGDSSTLYLIMAWRPLPKTSDAFTWFTATIGKDGPDQKSMRIGVEPSLKSLESHYGLAYTRPFDPCRIDAFGDLSVVPWTGAYPASGKARQQYND
jgi:hypothetical protein